MTRATAALGAATLGLGAGGVRAATPTGSGAGGGRSAPPLRLLILGGTGFIGPHQVRYARERGHELTLFNRGRSEPQLFQEAFRGVENLIGDRNGDLAALEGRTWDAVIDNSGYEPHQVRATAWLLESAVERYLFVSTQAVYADRSIIDQDESGEVGIRGIAPERWQGYGPLKALCERELTEVFGDRATIVRPSVIVGPGDRTDRYTYWVDRIDRGGDVLAPGDGHDPTQFIDVRDVTEFMVRLVEGDVPGVYNCNGPAGRLTVAGMLHSIRAVTTDPVRFVWVPTDFLLEQGVRPYTDLPLWQIPEGAYAGFFRMSNERAREAGLTYRPLATTAADTLAWWREQPAERRSSLRAGLSREEEGEILARWGERRG